MTEILEDLVDRAFDEAIDILKMTIQELEDIKRLGPVIEKLEQMKKHLKSNRLRGKIY